MMFFDIPKFAVYKISADSLNRVDVPLTMLCQNYQNLRPRLQYYSVILVRNFSKDCLIEQFIAVSFVS